MTVSPLPLPTVPRLDAARRPWRRWLLLAVLFGLGLGWFFLAGGQASSSLELLRSQRAVWLSWVELHPVLARAAFVALFAAHSSLALPGSLFLTLVGGMLFGPGVATCCVVVGATVGATVATTLARRLFGERVRRRVGERGRRLADAFAADGLSYLLFIRLVPLFPFWLVNLACGLTHLRLRSYVIATAVGLVPLTVIYAYAGSQVARLRVPTDVLTPGMLAALGLLALLALAPALHRRLRPRATTTER